MMNWVATGTMVNTCIHYSWISGIYIGVSHHLVRDMVGQNWFPMDVATSMATVSGGPKELRGVSGSVWSESVCWIDMIF